MEHIQSLYTRRKAVHADLLDLRGQVKGGELTPEQRIRFDAAQEEFNTLTSDIRRFEGLLDVERAMNDAEFARAGMTPAQRTQEQRLEEAFELALRRRDLTPEQRQLLQNTIRIEKRGTSTLVTTTDALGGYSVPEFFAKKLEVMMKWYGGVETVAFKTMTEKGGNYNFTSVDDTGNTGNQSTEAGTIAKKDTVFGTVILGAYGYDSGIIPVSAELLEDNGVDLENEIGPLIAERVGRIINTRLTVGTGSGQPNGCLTASAAGKTAASTTVFTVAELIDLQHSVDKAYRMNPACSFMMHDLTLAYIRKVDASATTTVIMFEPSLKVGEPDKVLGNRIIVNNDMPSTFTTGTKLVLFGDFSKYRIREVGGIRIRFSEHIYFEQNSVGYVGARRLDGNLLHAGALKHLKLA